MNNKNKQAIIIMHDIECEQYEGPGKLWKQIEKNKKLNVKLKNLHVKIIYQGMVLEC